MHKEAVADVLDKIDQQKLMKLAGVKPRAIRLARERGIFAAAWYPHVIEVCRERGVDCPMTLFNWRTVEDAE